MINILKNKIFQPKYFQSRNFWEWINMMFNKPDPERIKLVGPDRACAEWVLKNGGAIKLVGFKTLTTNYQDLPRGEFTKLVEEIVGTESSISHYGFAHLKGCKCIKKIVLDKSSYIDDRAIEGLGYLESPLEYLQISSCGDVTDAGLMKIPKLNDLKSLVLYDLIGVKHMMLCENHLQNLLPNCKIQINHKKN